MSGSMPALSPPPDYPSQSRARPGSQAAPPDIKYLSSPPGLSQLSLPKNVSQVYENTPPALRRQPPETQEIRRELDGYFHPASSVRVPSMMPVSSPSIISSQPQPSLAMSTTFKGSRNAKCIETGVDGKRTWSAGLFECGKQHTIALTTAQGVLRSGVLASFTDETKIDWIISLSVIDLTLLDVRLSATEIASFIAV
ncbi:hypothetical protein AAF712_009814 [Marasmius tenuissimus]|uniref:Uncharacterized protein n=1 Tax=Marasmius tenuissimus TaxID=585030 RepID=A0ABR2ZQ72_9AGAR